MKRMTKIYTYVLLMMGVLAFASCDSFLDEMPDNRAEVDSEYKIQKLLVSINFFCKDTCFFSIVGC